MDEFVYALATAFWFLFSYVVISGLYFFIAGDESIRFCWKHGSAGDKVVVIIAGLIVLSLPALFVIGTIAYF
jgi:hypothetical protein